MYAKRIQIDNVGPIIHLDYNFPFTHEGVPRPVVLVGPNGSGKSIFMSFIVNALISAKQLLFENAEVEAGKVYKTRSPNYINASAEYYFSKVSFEDNRNVTELQLRMSRKEYEAKFACTPILPEWASIPDDEISLFRNNFQDRPKELEDLLRSNCMLYFPPNRFEEPAWLNRDNLLSRPDFTDMKNVQRYSNRQIIQYSPLRKNRDWLMDIILDKEIYERKIVSIQDLLRQRHDKSVSGTLPDLPLFLGYTGQANMLSESILKVLRSIFLNSDQTLRFGVGNRKNRQISLIQNESLLVPNLFQLSTGETLVLDIFLSIIRDYDLAHGTFNSLHDVRGIVLIDELELHLHCDLQNKVLPLLIKYFPHVQFILTSHSPIFLMGMHREFSDDGFSILLLPESEEITVERFAEFQNAYELYRQSEHFSSDLTAAIQDSKKTIVFVEGTHDIKYILKAGTLLGMNHLFSQIDLLDGDGYGNLDNIWKHFNTRLSEVSPRKVILLYDCDVNKRPAEKGIILKRVIPKMEDHPIQKGIENLFPQATIDSARASNPQFIDIISATKKLLRGVEHCLPEVQEVNKDEKGNLCDWLCKNGNPSDFEHFNEVFALIEAAIQ